MYLFVYEIRNVCVVCVCTHMRVHTSFVIKTNFVLFWVTCFFAAFWNRKVISYLKAELFLLPGTLFNLRWEYA